MVIRDTLGRALIHLRRDPIHSRLWHPSNSDNKHTAFTIDHKTTQARLWNLQLGHAHPDSVIETLKSQGDIKLARQDFHACDECSQGQSSQSPATNPLYQSPSVLDVVYSDIIGPLHPPTINGNRYIITFIDDHTCFNTIYLLRNKSEALDKFKIFKKRIERQTGKKIGKLKSDQGGEYTSQAFYDYLYLHGI